MVNHSNAADNDEPQTLVAISFTDVFRAREFMTVATRLASHKDLVLDDVVLIVKDEHGKSTVTETKDAPPARSALTGAVWAGIFGLILAGPIGWAAGTAAGAGGGAIAAKLIDIGIPDEWVGWFREAVKPGSATVALLVSNMRSEALLTEARRFTGSHLVYANVDDEMLLRLTEALGDTTGPDAKTGPPLLS